MAEYLSKEEIRQWRSSLERITLEEFARRLGKTINEEKNTNDVVDKVMKDITFTTDTKPEYQTRSEKIIVVAQKALQKERELVNHVTPKATSSKQKPIKEIANSILPKEEKQEEKQPKQKAVNTTKINKEKTIKPKKAKTASKISESKTEKETVQKSISDFPFSLKKAFTQREQVVFDYLYNNKNQVVYAKDLAELLGLPRDYIYKYIKGIRSKLEEDTLSNATKGGFVLKV